jgi:RNA polymerase sigma-70 factor (ECF subfamily)
MLYRRHRDFMFRLAYRTVGDRDVAADAVQETTRYWMTKFPGFVLVGKVESFLYPVVRHTAIRLAEQQRKARGVGEVSSDPASSATPAISTDERGDRSRRLAEAVAKLPDGQREAVHLRFADGLSLAEIAEVLHVPVGTVKSRLSLATRTLAADPTLADLSDVI